MAVNYKSAVVITEGLTLKVGKLATNSRTPSTYTITTETAALSAATSISVTASGGNLTTGDDLYLPAGTELTFGSVTVTVADDVIVDQTTPTTVNLAEPASGAISDATAATTKALLPVLGLTEASPQNSTTTVDSTDFLSGFGQQTIVTGVNRTFNCSGNRIQEDRAMDRIVLPLMTDDDEARNEIYFELTLPSGEVFAGAGKVSDLNFTAGLRDIIKFSFTLTAQGSSYSYTPAVTYLTTKNA